MARLTSLPRQSRPSLTSQSPISRLTMARAAPVTRAGPVIPAKPRNLTTAPVAARSKSRRLSSETMTTTFSKIRPSTLQLLRKRRSLISPIPEMPTTAATTAMARTTTRTTTTEVATEARMRPARLVTKTRERRPTHRPTTTVTPRTTGAHQGQRTDRTLASSRPTFRSPRLTRLTTARARRMTRLQTRTRPIRLTLTMRTLMRRTTRSWSRTLTSTATAM